MASVGFVYLRVTWQGNTAIIRVTDDAYHLWHLMDKDSSWWPSDPDWRKGTWQKEWGTDWDFTQCLHNGNKAPLFRLKDLHFPPDLGVKHKFMISAGWIAERGGGETIGEYEPIITQLLVEDAKREAEKLREEIKMLAVEAGISLTNLLDPTGITSIAGAYTASIRGDYLACTLCLIAVIPLVGKAASLVRRYDIVSRLEKALVRLKSLQERITAFMNVCKKAGMIERCLPANLQNTTLFAKAMDPLAKFSVKLTSFAKKPAFAHGRVQDVYRWLDKEKFAQKVGARIEDGKNLRRGGSEIWIKERPDLHGFEYCRIDALGHTKPPYVPDAKVIAMGRKVGGKMESAVVGVDEVAHCHFGFVSTVRGNPKKILHEFLDLPARAGKKGDPSLLKLREVKISDRNTRTDLIPAFPKNSKGINVPRLYAEHIPLSGL